jgi:hypothetical protein
MHPSCTGVRKQQYPHRFRQTLVSGRKRFFENVIVRCDIRHPVVDRRIIVRW